MVVGKTVVEATDTEGGTKLDALSAEERTVSSMKNTKSHL